MYKSTRGNTDKTKLGNINKFKRNNVNNIKQEVVMEYFNGTKTIKTIDNKILENMAECLKVLAHPTRLKIIDILSKGGSFPVYCLAEICKKPHNQICAHLRLMKKCDIVGSKRKAKTVFYFINCDQIENLLKCMENKFNNSNEQGDI
jgi:ArsR family transcriptional regulator